MVIVLILLAVFTVLNLVLLNALSNVVEDIYTTVYVHQETIQIMIDCLKNDRRKEQK